MQSKFARDMMAQKLMSENKDNPFNSRFFQPSDAMAAPTRQGFSNLLSRMEQKDKQGTDVFPALAIGSGFAPSAGISDVLGFAPDPFNPGQTLPSFSDNIDRGNYLDAGLQTIGAGGDVMLAAAPFFPFLFAPAAAMKATSQLGKALRKGSKTPKSTDEIKDNVVELDFQKKKIEAELNKKDAPRDTSSGHAAEGLPPQFGPPAHDMNLKIDQEFTPEGFSTMSANFGENYENLANFVTSVRGTPEYREEVAFLKKLKEIKGNPEAEVTVYRASPTDDLRSGDLITPIKSDAEFYVEESKITRDDIRQAQRKARLDTDEPIDLKKEKMFRTMDDIIGLFPETEVSPSKVFTYKVKAKDIRWDGNNGLIRWGYFPDKS